MSQYFPPYRSAGGKIKVELDLSSYATTTDLKNVTHINVSSFVSKTNLARLKTEVDKIDVDKLKTVPVDLTKLSNVVKNDAVKNTEYNKLFTKVGNIVITGFLLKTKYGTNKSYLEKKISDTQKKIPNTSDLAKKTDLNPEIIEMENKAPSITRFSTNLVLTTVENKIPNVNNVVKKQTITQKLVKLKKG